MAKALLVCFREGCTQDFGDFLQQLSERLTPDNLAARKPYLYYDSRVLAYIHHPAPTIRHQQASLCLGLVTKVSEDMFRPRAPRPDGTFALFRSAGDCIEVLSDYTASRTIWYYFTPAFLIASTSQRMIITFLGNFRPNLNAARWMLSSGSLGPGESWDERLHALPSNTSLVLDRARWELQIERGTSLRFTPVDGPTNWHRHRLSEAVEKAVHTLDFDYTRWTLALSGGMDSRSLLYHLRNGAGLQTVTWGMRAALTQPDGDAALARQLAQVCHLPHEFAVMDADSICLSTILERFLIAGEGRIDHLHGYMDGLSIWASLSASERGIIRGYDAFGRKPPVRNGYHARRASSLTVTTDYSSSALPKEFALSEEDIPLFLSRSAGESLRDWRDRLWLEFRTPYVTAALDDIKTAYVEIVNPLLCQQVVETVQTLPEAFRENKAIFEGIVQQMFPNIPFAKRWAIHETDEILDLPSVTHFLRGRLLAARATNILPEDFLHLLVMQMESRLKRASVRRRLIVACKAHAPRFIENYLRMHLGHEPLNLRRLAWRALIIMRMSEMLAEDAQIGRHALGLWPTPYKDINDAHGIATADRRGNGSGHVRPPHRGRR